MFIHMSTGKLKPVFAFQKEREKNAAPLNPVKINIPLDLQMGYLEGSFHPVPY